MAEIDGRSPPAGPHGGCVEALPRIPGGGPLSQPQQLAQREIQSLEAIGAGEAQGLVERRAEPQSAHVQAGEHVSLTSPHRTARTSRLATGRTRLSRSWVVPWTPPSARRWR